MRKRVSDRLRKLRELIGQVPDGFLEGVLNLDIQNETCGSVHAEATGKTTRRAPF